MLCWMAGEASRSFRNLPTVEGLHPGLAQRAPLQRCSSGGPRSNTHGGLQRQSLNSKAKSKLLKCLCAGTLHSTRLILAELFGAWLCAYPAHVSLNGPGPRTYLREVEKQVEKHTWTLFDPNLEQSPCFGKVWKRCLCRPVPALDSRG